MKNMTGGVEGTSFDGSGVTTRNVGTIGVGAATTGQSETRGVREMQGAAETIGIMT